MNRTERLYALVEDLRRRAPQPLRATDMAVRYEVSTRTIERDLLALQEAGVPIWSQPGPGGGYGLDADMTLPPLNLTAAEATAIATALAATSAMPFAEAGRSALKKLTSAMAAPSRDAALRLVQQVRIARDASVPGSAVTEVIQRSLVERVTVDLTYRDTAGRETRRTIEPAGIVGTQQGWYLAAFCRLRQAPRVFRLDRIVEGVLTGESITPLPLDAIFADLPFDTAEPALM